MKRPILFSIGFLFLSALNAQQLCAPGAEWLFGFSSQQATGVRHAWYSGDTIVGGLAAKRIDQTVHAYEPTFPFGEPFVFQANPIHIAEVGDMVMLWSASSSSYDTLMWFGAQPGQHWDAPHYPGYARFDVLDTGTEIVSGIPLRYLVVEEPVVMGVIDTLRERIGFGYYYLEPNETFLIDFVTSRLQCYKDDQIPEFSGPMQQYPCDFNVAVNEHHSTLDQPMPNPGTGHFTLSLPLGTHMITLFNTLGSLVMRQPTTSAQATIDTRDLPSGVYLVRIDEKGPALRWVKE